MIPPSCGTELLNTSSSEQEIPAMVQPNKTVPRHLSKKCSLEQSPTGCHIHYPHIWTYPSDLPLHLHFWSMRYEAVKKRLVRQGSLVSSYLYSCALDYNSLHRNIWYLRIEPGFKVRTFRKNPDIFQRYTAFSRDCWA